MKPWAHECPRKGRRIEVETGALCTHCGATETTVEMLTDREKRMLELLADGCDSFAIGDDLGLTPGSVRVYLHNLYRKLGVKNKTQAALWFAKRAA